MNVRERGILLSLIGAYAIVLAIGLLLGRSGYKVSPKTASTPAYEPGITLDASDSSARQSPSEPLEEEVPHTPAPLPFRIVQRSDVSYAKVDAALYRVLVLSEAPPTVADLQLTADAIVTAAPSHHQTLTLLFYPPCHPPYITAYGAAEIHNDQGLTSCDVFSDTVWRVDADLLSANQHGTYPGWSPERGRRRAYALSLVARRAGSDSIDIRAATNLPEGARLLISVERPFWDSSNDEERVGTIYECDLPVTGGQVHTRVLVDDWQWLDANVTLDALAREDASWRRVAGGRLTQIGATIEVGAMFSPMREQRADVLATVGWWGERLGGPSASATYAGLRTLETTRTIQMRPPPRVMEYFPRGLR